MCFDMYLLISHCNIILQKGESTYRNAGFYQALPTTTTPGSSQSVPTLFPGLSEIYSYVIIGVIALVLAAVLCAAIMMIALCCYSKKQNKKQKGAPAQALGK